jgi:hypothetical protein
MSLRRQCSPATAQAIGRGRSQGCAKNTTDLMGYFTGFSLPGLISGHRFRTLDLNRFMAPASRESWKVLEKLENYFAIACGWNDEQRKSSCLWPLGASPSLIIIKVFIKQICKSFLENIAILRATAEDTRT